MSIMLWPSGFTPPGYTAVPTYKPRKGRTAKLIEKLSKLAVKKATGEIGHYWDGAKYWFVFEKEADAEAFKKALKGGK